MRLNKFLARAGVASRRSSEALIVGGRVKVNGEVITNLATQVEPALDRVELDDKLVELSGETVTLVLNKPEHYLTTMSDPEGRPCVAELVPCDQYPGLFPVGRLDWDTTGALLFSTDGELGQCLLHPSFEKDKVYVAAITSSLSDAEMTLFAKQGGIVLEDGPCAPAQIEEVPQRAYDELPSNLRAALTRSQKQGVKPSVWRLTIHEGRRHQVKRMFKALGHEVIALHRESFDGITCGALKSGEWRLLSAEEQKQLQS